MINAEVTQRSTEEYRSDSPARNSSLSNSLDAPFTSSIRHVAAVLDLHQPQRRDPGYQPFNNADFLNRVAFTALIEMVSSL